MIFSDRDLAQRLERAEADGGAQFVDARRRVFPNSGAEWIGVAGAKAMFDGPTSPVTQTFGLGLFAEATDEDLQRLESFFVERGAPVAHEVSPLAGVQLADRLCARGYRAVEFTSVMYRSVPVDTGVAPATAVRTRQATPTEASLFSEVSARGWESDHPEVREFLLDNGRVLSACEGYIPFFGEVDREAIATAVLRCHGGVALLAGASTVPEARRMGAQQALLHARLALAASKGCDLAMICAEPGSASQRNAERNGFRIAYTRTKWQLSATSPHPQ
jgi:hypothetical protein